MTNDCPPAKTDTVSLGCKTLDNSNPKKCTAMIETDDDMYTKRGPKVLV